MIRDILKISIYILLALVAFSCGNPKHSYKKSVTKKTRAHHHGFFHANDRATRKNEKFKKKTSKAGDNKKTNPKVAKSKKVKPSYVKTFDHH